MRVEVDVNQCVEVDISAREVMDQLPTPLEGETLDSFLRMVSRSYSILRSIPQEHIDGALATQRDIIAKGLREEADRWEGR